MQRGVLKLLLACLACLAYALALACYAASPVTIKDIRVWAGPTETRLVLDLSAPVEHTLLSLQNPDRVVVDLAAARLDRTDQPCRLIRDSFGN